MQNKKQTKIVELKQHELIAICGGKPSTPPPPPPPPPSTSSSRPRSTPSYTFIWA